MMSRPRTDNNLLSTLLFGTDSRISRTVTTEVTLFGSSIPTVFLPGIGA